MPEGRRTQVIVIAFYSEKCCTKIRQIWTRPSRSTCHPMKKTALMLGMNQDFTGTWEDFGYNYVISLNYIIIKKHTGILV